MKLPYKPLWIAASAIALGGAVVLFTRTNTPATEPRHAPVAMTSNDPLPDDEAAPPQQPSSAAGPLPWENHAAVQAPTAEVGPADVSPPAQPPVAVLSPAQIQKRLVEGDVALNKALEKLNEAEGSGRLPPELDARAMRTNLNVAKRSQQLAGEMLLLSQQPADETHVRRMEAIVSELKQLQSQVQADVMLPATGSTR